MLIIILGLVNRPTLKPDFFVFIVIFTFPEICPDSILASVSMNEWDGKLIGLGKSHQMKAVSLLT